MKEKSAGKNIKLFKPTTSGFSTIELMIAFALMCIVLVGAVNANFSAQYWGITAQTANEGLYKAKTTLEDLRSLVKQDFYQAVSSPLIESKNPSDPADASCIAGGLCYSVQKTVTDLSSCSKYVEATVEWQVSNYPETTTRLYTYLTNTPEIINRGGDCILNQPSGDWANNPPSSVGSLSFIPGKQFTGIDVLHKKIYVTASTSPGFMIYGIPTTVGQNPTPFGTLDIKVNGVTQELNSVDVEEDLSTGRTYAFVAVNATTKQLAVIDVTDPSTPTLVAQRDLQNVDSLGSYPEGWLVFVYGGRLYMTTRETAGNEFHIFNITTPTIPTEIGNGFKLGRTINSMIVRDQKISGVTHRLVFLASDSDTKELSILDVTGDTVTELNSLNLPGSQEGLSLSLLGNDLYFGRDSNTSGPELYVFDVTNPTANLSSVIEGTGEVGAGVTNIEVSGKYAYIGTKKTGQEFQVWNSDYSTWTGSLNVGRFTSYNSPNLSPLGFDIDGDWIYTISQNTASDKLEVLGIPTP
jgi:Tfp pilus assembly protein PilV